MASQHGSRKAAPKDRGLNKIDKLFVGGGAQPCAPTENAEVIKFLFLSFTLLPSPLTPHLPLTASVRCA